MFGNFNSGFKYLLTPTNIHYLKHISCRNHKEYTKMPKNIESKTTFTTEIQIKGQNKEVL